MSPEIYEKKLDIRSSQVDPMQRLRLGSLFTLLQEASIDHTEALGAGRDQTLDRGLLWVVVQQYAKISRLPLYGEKCTLRSWPGEMLHLFFPRYYTLTGEGEEELAAASALWALMDRQERRIVFPEDCGVSVPGTDSCRAIPLPVPPRLPGPQAEKREFTVPYSALDINGHVNNTRYLDLWEDCMPASLRGMEPREISVEYSAEAREGDCLSLALEERAGVWLFAGSREGRRLFRMSVGF